ncbi:MAG: sigma-E processing peptidase SpoIIGA [Clostridia bacterium]|nr:sigma-E processing peptidase SpoIIGA [Clostridia bacterium]
MTVYVELVIFNNLAVDLLLEIATLTVFRRKIKWWRVLLASILGASVATAYPLLADGWQFAIRILLAPAMTLVFDGFHSKIKGKSTVDKKDVIRREIVEYFKRLSVFCLATYLVGGVSYGINFALGIDVASYWQFGVVTFALLTMLIIVRVLVVGFSKNAQKICSVKVCVSGREIDTRALLDSGNSLTDSLSGLPVVIMSQSAEKKLLRDESLIEGYVSVKTVGGESDMPIVRLDGVDVKGKKYSAYGALSRQDYDDFEIILQNTMF